MLGGVSQTQKDKYCIILFMCQTDRSRKQNGIHQGLGSGRNGEMLVKGYKVSVMQAE